MDRTSWLDTAVSGIRFGPDRRAVRAELEGHMEDKTADLQRIFPGIPEEEARERALAGMGDPEELKASLAKVHKPGLGWLWTASRWALWVTLLALNLIALGTRTEYGNSLRGRSGTEIYGPVRDGERARLGQYTFRITAAAYLDVPEDGVRADTLQLVLRASSPRFWERLSWEAFYDSLTAVGPDGTRYPMDRQDIRMDESKGIHQLYTGSAGCKWGIFWREAAVYLPAEGWRPGDRVTLELESPAGRISLSAPVTERVEVP